MATTPKKPNRESIPSIARTSTARPPKVYRMITTDRSEVASVQDFATIADLRAYAYQDPYSGVQQTDPHWQEEITRLYPEDDRRFVDWFVQTYQAIDSAIILIYGYPDYEILSS